MPAPRFNTGTAARLTRMAARRTDAALNDEFGDVRIGVSEVFGPAVEKRRLHSEGGPATP